MQLSSSIQGKIASMARFPRGSALRHDRDCGSICVHAHVYVRVRDHVYARVRDHVYALFNDYGHDRDGVLVHLSQELWWVSVHSNPLGSLQL